VAIIDRMLRSFLLATFAGLVSTFSVSAQTTVAVPCDLDNTLYEDGAGAFSNARGESLFVGVTAQGRVRRALVRFDVAGNVPAGARVIAARLELNVIQSGAATSTDVGVHRVLAAWGEGTSYAITGGGGQGAPSTVGDATWIHAAYPTIGWPAGGAFATAPSVVVSMPTFGLCSSAASMNGNADVQSWLDDPAQNFGWLLKAATETVQAARARRLDSRESLGTKPTLHVTYVVPGQGGTWGTGCPTANGAFGFAFGGAIVGGTTLPLLHTSGPSNGLAGNFFALDLDPAGVALAPGCTVWLPGNQPFIAGFLLVLDGAGNGAVPWTLPTNYPGLFFMSQSVALDTNPLGFVLSNAGVASIQ